MSILVEANGRVLLGAEAFLVEDGRELAWAEKHVVKNKAHKFIIGRFVEADRPNENGHIFDFKELGEAQKSLLHSPLNMVHQPHSIVGSFIASEMMHPTAETAEEEHPYVEALACFWRYYFPDEYKAVEKAHRENSLFFSMECVPETVKCTGVCQQEYAYDGRTSPTYCAHMNEPAAIRRLGKPHFTGGALILPPVKPGWKKADITSVSALLAAHAEEAESLFQVVKTEKSHLDALQWEAAVAQLLVMAYRDPEWAKGFPPAALPTIENPQDLANAIKSVKKALPWNVGALKKHIEQQAKKLKVPAPKWD